MLALTIFYLRKKSSNFFYKFVSTFVSCYLLVKVTNIFSFSQKESPPSPSPPPSITVMTSSTGMTNSMQDDLSSSASPKLNKDEEMGDVITDHKTAVSQSNYFSNVFPPRVCGISAPWGTCASL